MDPKKNAASGQEPEPTSGVTGPAGTGDEDQNPDPAQGEGNDPSPTPEDDNGLPADLPDEKDDAAWAKLPKWVQKLRGEAAKNRVKARQEADRAKLLEQELQQLRDKDLSEQEKELNRLRKRETEDLPQLERQNRELRVQLIAHEKGIVDPEAVVRLLDWDSIGTSDEDFSAAVDELVERKSYLKKSDDSTSTTTTKNDNPPKKPVPTQRTSSATPPSNHQQPKWTKAGLAKMTPDEIDANWESIQEEMKAGRIK